MKNQNLTLGIIRASKMPIDGQLHRHKSVLKVFFISGLTFTLALYISYLAFTSGINVTIKVQK